MPVLKRIEAKGLLETARRTKQRCGQVFRQGIGLGLCERDIASDFRGLLEAPTVEHHAAITDPAAVGALLCKIDRYAGRALTRLALKLSPLVFVRPHNLRKARWEDVDLETGHLDESIERLGVKVLKSPPRSPIENAVCERVIGTVRRECLDWFIPLNIVTV